MNPLLNMFRPTTNINSVSGIMSMLKNGNPEDAVRTLCSMNPQFKSFYEANRGKSVQQICRENNIDPETVRQFFK